MERSTLSLISLLTGSNYLVWTMKMEAILSLKKLNNNSRKARSKCRLESKDRMGNKE